MFISIIYYIIISTLYLTYVYFYVDAFRRNSGATTRKDDSSGRGGETFDPESCRGRDRSTENQTNCYQGLIKCLLFVKLHGRNLFIEYWILENSLSIFNSLVLTIKYHCE